MKNKKNCKQEFDKKYYTTGGYKEYLKWFDEEGLEYADGLIKFFKPKKSWKFLDVGCGMGGVVLALRKKGFLAWGTEISAFCLEKSPIKKWLKKGNILSLPFKDKSFDVVLAMDMLFYLSKSQQKKALLELHRIAKRFLFLETICLGSANSSQKSNPDALRRQSYLFTKKQMLALLQKSGFELVGPLFTEKDNVIDFCNIFKAVG
jgi:ubiquinone/menaquinone biosynthesis C-methylase UbiE